MYPLSNLSLLFLALAICLAISNGRKPFNPNLNPDTTDYCILIPPEAEMMKDIRAIFKQTDRTGWSQTYDLPDTIGISNRISMLSGSLNRYRYPETMWKCASDYADEPCDKSFMNLRETYHWINRGGHGTIQTWQFNIQVVKAFRETPQIASELLWGCKAGTPPPIFHSYGCVACMVSNGSVVVTLTVNKTSVRDPFPVTFPVQTPTSPKEQTTSAGVVVNTTSPGPLVINSTARAPSEVNDYKDETNTTRNTESPSKSNKHDSLGRLEISIIVLSIVVALFVLSASSCVLYKRSSSYKVRVKPSVVHTDVEAVGGQH